MAVLCPKTITLDDGARCELFDQFDDDYFGGLLTIHVCSYKCSDGTYLSRWRMRCCCIRGPIREHRFRPN